MASGTVKWFNITKRYGFIEPDDGSKDIFVHLTAVKDSGLNELKDNQKVSYDLENKDNKISAINIQLLDT